MPGNIPKNSKEGICMKFNKDDITKVIKTAAEKVSGDNPGQTPDADIQTQIDSINRRLSLIEEELRQMKERI
jgi:hypothetical protein